MLTSLIHYLSSILRKAKTYLTKPIGKGTYIDGKDFGFPNLVRGEQLDFLNLVDTAPKVLYWPFDYRSLYITQAFGGNHKGLDIGIPNRTKLYNPLPERSQIVKVGWDTSGYGNMVGIKSGRWYVILGHLSQINPDLRVGDWVDPGEFLGWSDSTGNSTGPHLHFELRESEDGSYFPYPSSCRDPYPYLRWRVVTPPVPPTPPPPPPTPTPKPGWYRAMATQELRMYRKQKTNTMLDYPRIASGAVINVTNRKTIGTTQWVMLENGFFTVKKSGPFRYLKDV